MRSIFKHSIALAACTVCLLSPRAHADIPPPDICLGEGSVCDNAGPAGTLPGICTASTCSSANPDGGIIQRDCLRCLPASGGSGGTGAAGAPSAGAAGVGATGSGTAGAGGSHDDDGGCSCRLSAAATERTLAGAMVLAGLAALRVWRRRR